MTWTRASSRTTRMINPFPWLAGFVLGLLVYAVFDLGKWISGSYWEKHGPKWAERYWIIEHFGLAEPPSQTIIVPARTNLGKESSRTEEEREAEADGLQEDTGD